MVLALDARFPGGDAPHVPSKHRGDRKAHHAREYVREHVRERRDVVRRFLRYEDIYKWTGSGRSGEETYSTDDAVAERLEQGGPAKGAVAEGGNDKVCAAKSVSGSLVLARNGRTGTSRNVAHCATRHIG